MIQAAIALESSAKNVSTGQMNEYLPEKSAISAVPQTTNVFAAYAGSESCRSCHADEYAAWAKSHHGLAERLWRGDFDGSAFEPARTFSHGSQTTEMRRTNGQARAGDESAREPLLLLLAINEIPFWKAVTAGLLGQWTDQPRVTSALTNLLLNESSLVRAKAVKSLAGLHQPEIEAVVREPLNDPVRGVRFQASWALREKLETNLIATREIWQTIQTTLISPWGKAQQAVWLLSHGEVNAALAHYAKAIAWDSNSPPFRIDYATALSLAGQSSNALTQIQAGCRLAPSDPENFYRLGLAWNEVGDAVQTIVAPEEAVRLNPRQDRALYNLGLAYNQQGNTAKAFGTLHRAEVANPHDSRIPYAPATILAQTGRTAEAVDAAKRALKIMPDNSAAKELLRVLSQ